MFGAVIAGIVESVGDYYACARICGKSIRRIKQLIVCTLLQDVLGQTKIRKGLKKV